MTRWPAASTAAAASRITCWPARVIALATAGEKSRQAEAPRTPKREFMRIFVAWAPTASPCFLAWARSSQSRATSSGRMPGSSARNAAPLGVRTSGSPASRRAGRTWVRGSMLNVRIRLG